MQRVDQGRAVRRQLVTTRHVSHEPGAEQFGEPGDENALAHATDRAAEIVERQRAAAQLPQDPKGPAPADEIEEFAQRARGRRFAIRLRHRAREPSTEPDGPSTEPDGRSTEPDGRSTEPDGRPLLQLTD